MANKIVPKAKFRVDYNTYYDTVRPNGKGYKVIRRQWYEPKWLMSNYSFGSKPTSNTTKVKYKSTGTKTISKQSVSVTPAQERYLQQQRRNRQNTGRNEADGLGRFLGNVSSTIRGTSSSKPTPTPTSNGNKTLASINKANTIRKQKLVAAANARRKAQQEAAKEKEKSSAGTTQVVATSGGAAVAPKSPRNTGGRTTGGRTAPRRRRYLDSTPTVPRSRRQRAVAPAKPIAPKIDRAEVSTARVVPEIAPRVIQVDVPNPVDAANQLVRNENYSNFIDLRRRRQQYKCGGRIRRK